MSYNPRQLRGPDGRWISTGARRVSRSARSKANKRAYAGRRKKRSAPIRINRSASRRQRGVGVSGLKKNFIPYLSDRRRYMSIRSTEGI